MCDSNDGPKGPDGNRRENFVKSKGTGGWDFLLNAEHHGTQGRGNGHDRPARNQK